jgi:hypothetical protein
MKPSLRHSAALGAALLVAAGFLVHKKSSTVSTVNFLPSTQENVTSITSSDWETTLPEKYAAIGKIKAHPQSSSTAFLSRPEAHAKAALPGFPASHYLLKKAAAAAIADDQSDDAAHQPSPGWTPLATGTPGATLFFSGREAVIAATKPVPDAGNPSLSININPAIETPVATQPEETASYQRRPVMHRGFTYEEEIFRTKWGWAAYDQVQKVLREESSE